MQVGIKNGRFAFNKYVNFRNGFAHFWVVHWQAGVSLMDLPVCSILGPLKNQEKKIL